MLHAAAHRSSWGGEREVTALTCVYVPATTSSGETSVAIELAWVSSGAESGVDLQLTRRKTRAPASVPEPLDEDPALQVRLTANPALTTRHHEGTSSPV